MVDMAGCVWREYDRHDRVCVDEYDRHDRMCVEGSMMDLTGRVWRAVCGIYGRGVWRAA